MEDKTALFRPVTITFETIDRLTKEKNPADLLGLYVSYAAIVQWQQTVNIKATTGFMAQRLGWGKDKVIRNKKKLEQLGLIESIVRKDKSNKITDHYIRVMYVITHDVHTTQIPEGGLSHRVESKDTSASNEQVSAVNVQSAKKNEQELLQLLNKNTGRNFRVLPATGMKKLLNSFSLVDIDKALRALAADDWHADRIKELSSEYLLRPTTIDKWLGVATNKSGGYRDPRVYGGSNEGN
jgi:hypothetical protein